MFTTFAAKKSDFFKITKNELILLSVGFLIIGFVSGFFVYNNEETETAFTYQIPDAVLTSNQVNVRVPAVDANGNGVTGTLTTIARPAAIPGAGLILVSVNNIVAQFDTQMSARTAAMAAGRYTETNITDWDIIYIINVQAQAIEGPSAGAAMAVSAAAAINNHTLDNGVSITGSIQEDGRIRPVGSVDQKIRAAQSQNVTTFLVAKGQGIKTNTEKERVCNTVEGVEYCRIHYKSTETNVGENFGVNVVEVEDVGEALEYFVLD